MSADSPDTIDRVLAEIDTMRLREGLFDAVDHYSPTYAEPPVLAFLEGLIREAGLPYRAQYLADEEPPDGRRNLLIELGPQPPSLVWLGHVDTVVPPDGEYDSPRWESEEGGEVLYGLGTADMKGACIAAIEAARAIHACDVELERGLLVALVVGEEEYGDGTERLLEDLPRADLAIVGEPTALAPCWEHYGYAEYHLRTTGNRAHAALPEVGDNAIHAMLDWLTGILEARRRLPRADEIYVNPRVIAGGSALFAVAESCEAYLDVHTPAGYDPTAVEAILDRAREAAGDRHGGCGFAMERKFWAPGYATEQGMAAISGALERIGRPTTGARFRSHSDASLLDQRGIPAVVCGPGRLEVAHTPHESIALDELVDAARLYATIFAQWSQR